MKKTFFLALCSALLFSACEPEEIIEVPKTGDYTFSGSITPSASFSSNDQISVSAYTDAQYSNAVAQNVLYTYNGSLFKSNNAIEYTEDEQMAFRAIYPYEADRTDSFTFVTNTDQSSTENYNASDLMLAKASLSSEIKPTLSFSHCLSQVIITISSGDTPSSVTVNAKNTAECNVASGTYEGTGSVANISALSAGNNAYKVVVAPQTITAGTTLAIINLSGIECRAVLTEDVTFKSGSSYACNGVITSSGEFSFEFSTNTWDNGGTSTTTPDDPSEPEDESSVELIWDGNFESGEISQVTNNWSVATAAISADGEGYNGEGHAWTISNSEVRSEEYLAQFTFILNSTLQAGDELQVSFNVRSENGSDITGLGMGISVDPYHVETIVLEDGGSSLPTSTEWSTAAYNITITEDNAITEKLTFSIGSTVDKFYLDNVSVIRYRESAGGGSTESDEIVDPECAGVDFVKNMGVGWNLGNSLDAIGGETAWGNPSTTQAMINAVANKGFGTLRVPITWYQHLSSDGEYTIDESWLDRVETVVNYGFNNDMYVIIDIHHDEDIIVPSYDDLEESKKVVTAIWTQVAARFKDYSDKLIFESLNEMRVEGSANEWSGGDAEGRDCVNQLHTASLEAIRSSGGNNATRKVMLSPYAASNNSTAMAALEIPEDDENIIVSIHSYSPYEFCMNEEGTDREWGSDYDKAQLDDMFREIYNLFVAKGIPVIMGEWGSITANAESERAEHAEYYAQRALDFYICPVVWDDGGNFQILDRSSSTWKYETMADAIVKAVN